jgi:hypothetical protein
MADGASRFSKPERREAATPDVRGLDQLGSVVVTRPGRRAAVGVCATVRNRPYARAVRGERRTACPRRLATAYPKNLDMPDLEDAKARPQELQRQEFDFGYSPNREHLQTQPDDAIR